MPEDVTLHTAGPKQVTVVSNIFIDQFMSQANGEYVKIYLYLLRCLSQNGQSFSVSQMADKFDHTEKDIKRALHYWEEHKLLRLEYNASNELTGICMLDPSHVTTSTDSASASVSESSASTVSKTAATAAEPKLNVTVVDTTSDSGVPTYSLEQLKAFQNDNNIAELLFIIETYLRHPLSSNDMNTIIYWYDGLKLSSSVIDYLVQYCIEKNHTSIRYMHKVALSYADDGITSVEEAKARNNMHSTQYYTVAKSLGITNRSLIQSEQEFIEKWTKIYKLPLDIITEACKRTIVNTQKPSFDYTDTILKNWHEKNVKTLEDIAKLDAEHNKNKVMKKASSPQPMNNNRFHNFSERNNDYSALERKLLQN